MALPVRGSPLSRVHHFKVGGIWMYTFIIVWLARWESCQFLPYIAGMAMDEQAARSDVEKLQELLDCTAVKSKKQKEKTEEQHITYEHLEQLPYIMWQSAWELDWDRVQALYCFHIGIPTFIIDDSIIAQWLPTVSPSGPQQWTDSEDSDTLYAHAVLFSLMPT